MEIPSEDLRKCRKCGVDKPLSAMSRGHSKVKRSRLCKGCAAAIAKRSRRAKEALHGMSSYRIALSKLTPYEQQKFRERHVRHTLKSIARRLNKMSDAELAAHKAKIKIATDARRAALKLAAYAAYGGYRCNCCGETERLFLSIDHVNNDGNVHRREAPKMNGGYSFHVWLRDNGYPTGFQILCMNCQTGKRLNGGVCPHKSYQVTCDGQGASPYAQASGSAVQLSSGS